MPLRQFANLIQNWQVVGKESDQCHLDLFRGGHNCFKSLYAEVLQNGFLGRRCTFPSRCFGCGLGVCHYFLRVMHMESCSWSHLCWDRRPPRLSHWFFWILSLNRKNKGTMSLALRFPHLFFGCMVILTTFVKAKAGVPLILKELLVWSAASSKTCPLFCLFVYCPPHFPTMVFQSGACCKHTSCWRMILAGLGLVYFRVWMLLVTKKAKRLLVREMVQGIRQLPFMQLSSIGFLIPYMILWIP